MIGDAQTGVAVKPVLLDKGWLPPNAAQGDMLAQLEDAVSREVSADCRAIGFRSKFHKLLVEFVQGDSSGASLIAKVYENDRGKAVFEWQSQLWEAGFRPPSAYTVVRPAGYLRQYRTLVQEKAPGRAVADFLFAQGGEQVFGGAARWVAALQASGVTGESRATQWREMMKRFRGELLEALPTSTADIEALVSEIIKGLEESLAGPLVPAHGDLHPKNLFVAEDGRYSAIDLDTFGLQEPVAEVAYFLTQTAIIGYFRGGSFSNTASCRARFLQTYEEARGPLSRERLGLYSAASFLQSLHYEICVLRNRKWDISQPWLSNSKRCLRGEIELAEGG
ncbi:MAG: aminoglycoside phosphotransferase family protein [Bryobacterales bacterium]|nr:aminoglycoside phosphotransferase family protein [Bryobacterales bacterium]